MPATCAEEARARSVEFGAGATPRRGATACAVSITTQPCGAPIDDTPDVLRRFDAAWHSVTVGGPVLLGAGVLAVLSAGEGLSDGVLASLAVSATIANPMLLLVLGLSWHHRARAAFLARVTSRGACVCSSCGYDLRGLHADPRCPECGTYCPTAATCAAWSRAAAPV